MTQTRRLAVRWVLAAMLERGVTATAQRGSARREPRRRELPLTARQLRRIRVSPSPVISLSLLRDLRERSGAG